MTRHSRLRRMVAGRPGLEADERNEVNAHLATCAECRSLGETYSNQDAMLRSQRVSAPPREMRAEVYRRIEQLPTPRRAWTPPRTQNVRSWLAPLVSAATIAVVVLASLAHARVVELPGQSGTGALPTPAGHGPPQYHGTISQLYERAMKATKNAARVRVVIRTRFGTNGRTYVTDLRTIAPYRSYTSRDDGSRGSPILAERSAHVGTAYCFWGIGPRPGGIECSHRAWGSEREGARGIRPLVPSHPSLKRGVNATQRPIVPIEISGTVRASLCEPGAKCLGLPPPPRRYDGTLVVDSQSGQPLSLQFRVYSDGRVAMQQQITYSFDRSFSITLPHGPRVACSLDVPRGTWCMTQPGGPAPEPTVPPSTLQAARAAVNGFGRAEVHHNASQARAFVTSKLSKGCTQYSRGSAPTYLRCLIDGTPLPNSYWINWIGWRTTPKGPDLTATVVYYFGNGHSQPLYENLVPVPGGYRISAAGVPRG